MIRIVYHRAYRRVTVDGHAQSGEDGHDLVCAAVSALAYTLGASIVNMEAAGQVRDAVTRFDGGHAELACRAPHRMRATVTLVFDTVCVGFELLAGKYPQNVAYEILE